MKILNVNTNNKKYSITFHRDFSNVSDEIINLEKNYSKIAVISDDNVDKLYTDIILKELEKVNNKVFSYSFTHGEENKNHNTIINIYDFLINNKFDRKSLLVALGGGVTGDMVGYVAATFMRGIDFIQIPTSLLSQVDSSIGGKTGIDFNGYKNIVGAFHQPELVYINTSTLKTLPTNEFNSGMGEVIKHGLIKDSNYLNSLIINGERIKQLDHVTLTDMIMTSCSIKADVVSEDEKEHGLRAILNFGHTIGHAIERLKNFELLHGECVAIGMIGAAYISLELGTLTNEEVNKIYNVIDLYNLPTYVENLNEDVIYNEMFHDKKTANDSLSFVLLNNIGDNYIKNDTPKEIIINAIRKIIK